MLTLVFLIFFVIETGGNRLTWTTGKWIDSMPGPLDSMLQRTLSVAHNDSSGDDIRIRKTISKSEKYFFGHSFKAMSPDGVLNSLSA